MRERTGAGTRAIAAPFLLISFVFIALTSVVSVHAQAGNGPQQVHLALTGVDSELRVMWADGSVPAKKPAVRVCRGTKTTYCQTIAAEISQHYDAPLMYVSPEFHIATIRSLTPMERIYYQVGDNSTKGLWSESFWADAPRPDGLSSLSSSPMVIGVVGDNGVAANSHRVAAQLIQEINASAAFSRGFEMLVHPGDISYANGIEKYWDQWANMVQPFAAHKPWQVAPGNHEIFDAFIPYLYRFKMPAAESGARFGNLYYSWNYGPVHFIALDSENLEYWHSDDPLGQYEWLKADLAKVNRTVTPWVMSFWHSPWYCSNTHHQGSGNAMRKSFEDLFHQYRVDIVFDGHVHAYERTLPIYNGKIDKTGTVYLTVGTGGNHEGLYNSWENPLPAWSAHREAHYGYGSLRIFNATHAEWEFVQETSLDAVLDHAIIVRASA